MGAFDTYEGSARCPRCHDVHWPEGQTKFFAPSFGGLVGRHFVPGAAQPIDFDPDLLLEESPWAYEWLRIRDGGTLEDLRLLAAHDEQFACSCGAPMALVLHLRFTAETATLTALELRDALAAELPAEIDLAEAPPDLWRGSFEAYQRALAELAAAPVEVRSARLRQALLARFTEVEAPRPPWTVIRAPMRCEACGDLRERSVAPTLSHPSYAQSPLGARWQGGLLRPGDRLVDDLAWLAEDVDRGCWRRLRHPVSGPRLVLLAAPCDWGCRCGAGRASAVLWFTREAGGLRFDGAALRVVRGRGELADVDFAETTWLSRDPPCASPWPQRKHGSLDETITALLSEWRVDLR